MTVKLDSQQRLAALEDTGLLDSLPDIAFDRLTRLVQKLLNVPVSLISLIDDQRQFFKSAMGLAEPLATERETPLSHSFCQFVVKDNQALVIKDSNQHLIYKDHPANTELGVTAYLGIPLKTPSQEVIGALCAIDSEPRQWTADEMAILNDIAEIAMSEIAMRQALREKEAFHRDLEQGWSRLRNLIDNLFCFVGLLTPEGILIEANKPALEAAKLSASDVIGKSFEETYWWTYDAKVQNQLKEAIAKARSGETSRYDVLIRLAEGEFITIDFMLAPIFDEAGTVTYLVPSGLDVSGRIESQNRLKRQSEMLNLAHDAIIVWSREQGIESWNKGAAELYGFSEKEALGCTTHELLKTRHPMSLPKFEALLALKGEWEGEVSHQSKSGQEITVSTRHQVIDKKAFRVLEINRDISEQTRVKEALVALNGDLENRVQQRTLELERSLEELNQFTYVASHDLKAPLRAIDNLATWIEEDASAHLPAASKRHLGLMKGRIHRLERLLEDLLAYSRADRTSYNLEAFNLTELIESIIEMLNPNKSFKITVRSEIQTICSTRVPLETVIRNLVNNALKHHDREQGKIDIKTWQQDDYLHVLVSDDGPGIDSHYFDKIFMIFQTLQPRDKVESSGVGLAIVKKLVESHGGVIKLESELGKGSSFSFSWQLALEPLNERSR